jgi:hypothetical protein
MQIDSELSFARDIRPLFRDMDVQHMKPMGVLLDDFEYMSNSENAQSVYNFLTGKSQPQMPPGGPFWGDDSLKLYARWMDAGRKP